MIWFDMDYTVFRDYTVFSVDYLPFYLIINFLIYILFILLFFILRYYITSKSLIIFCSLILLSILYHYYRTYMYFLDKDGNLTFGSTNFVSEFSTINFSLYFSLNKLSFLFSFLVFLIGFLTNIYSLNYFKNEADEMGFLFWLNSFIISMVILVMSNNFYTLFLGWELIGLTSFFLINFWSSRRATLKASFKAFSFNLISDLSLLTALVVLYVNYHTTSISELSTLLTVESVGKNYTDYIAGILLLTCASIKSVQILGHLWLPDSMEAPVPASSLIHSATLVSAGVFLLLRFYFLIEQLELQKYIFFLGCFTAAYGGVVAAAQTDVKRLLAYSTMSHCGFLFVLVSTNDIYVTIVYLFLHGIFKASTFFCVGSFIRIYGTQDTRLMGSATQVNWIDTFFFLLCASNLCGLPFTVGITYKNLFLRAIVLDNINTLCIGFIFIGLLCSLIYFYRLIYYTIFDIWKINWASTTLYREMYNNNGVKDPRVRFFWPLFRDSRQGTFSHWFVMFLMTIAIFYIYSIIIFYNNDLFRNENVMISYTLNSNILKNFLKSFYISYLVIFYSLYLLIYLIILLITWRKNIYFFNKFYLLLYLPLIILVL